jgi:uncharacterized membrane protein (DUF106 family)
MTLQHNTLVYWLLVILALTLGLVAWLAYIALTDRKQLKKHQHDSH